MNSMLDRYNQDRCSVPRPGQGCHGFLLRMANHGVMAGLMDDQIERDIRQAIPAGTRVVSNREIAEAVAKARMDHTGGDLGGGGQCWARPQPEAPPCPDFDGDQARAAIIRHGGGALDVMDILDVPDPNRIRLTWPPHEDSWRLVETLYRPDDRLFIGSRYDAGRTSVRPAAEWIAFLQETAGRGMAALQGLGETHAHVIPNPLTGMEGRTKDGKLTFRGDDCVKDFRYAVVEFDSIPKPQQFAFWRGFRLPVVALIDSGGKSVHAWILVGCRDSAEWTDQVENRLFRNVLQKLGVDGACKNESRMSRLPGVPRVEKGTWQRLVYLCAEGGVP